MRQTCALALELYYNNPILISLRMLQSLQEESHKAQQQKFEALSQLQTIDSTKQGLEEKLTELQQTNTQLQVCLLGLLL